MQVAIFIAGSLFSLIVQWVASELTYRRERKKEYWIRKLNSYQNFDQFMRQTLDLLKVGIGIPEDVLWNVAMETRKAAYDAEFFDTSHRERTGRMQFATLRLLRARSTPGEVANINEIEREIDAIRTEFLREERLLT